MLRHHWWIWQSHAIYLGREPFSSTRRKTGLFFPGCYLPTTSLVCFFVFLSTSQALGRVGWFSPGLMIFSHVHTTSFFLFFTMLDRLSRDKKAAGLFFWHPHLWCGVCMRCSRSLASISSIRLWSGRSIVSVQDSKVYTSVYTYKSFLQLFVHINYILLYLIIYSLVSLFD